MAVFLGACLGVQAIDHEKGVSADATVNTDRDRVTTTDSTDRNRNDRTTADRNDNGKLSRGDANFVKEASQGGLMEVKMGQTAKDHASNAEVKNYGEMLVKDHTKANDKLSQLASQKGVNLAKEMEPKHTGMIKDFENKSGADFDRAFIQHAIKDHKKDISKFEKASRDLNDTELRSFASETLPTLRTHLEEAQRIARSMGIDVNVTDASEYGADATASAASAQGSPGLSVQSQNSSVNRVEIDRGPDAHADVNIQHDRDASAAANANVDVKTDKSDGKTLGVETRAGDNKTLGIETQKGDNKVLGIQTRPGDGKTLGLNTRKDDGKLLGIIPAPGHKKAENRVDVDVNSSNDRDTSIGAPASSEKGANVDVKVDHDKNMKTLAYSEVPAKVQDTIRAEGGSTDVKGIKKHMMNGKTAYRVEFKKDGRNKVLHISEDGTIIKDNNK